MTDKQADALHWLAFVNAERRRLDAPARDIGRLWLRRLLRHLTSRRPL